MLLPRRTDDDRKEFIIAYKKMERKCLVRQVRDIHYEQEDESSATAIVERAKRRILY